MVKCGNKTCNHNIINGGDCEGINPKVEGCTIFEPLTTQKDAVADVPLQCGVMCASCRKECTDDDLHEVKGTTTLSNHTMTFRVCDDCDPQDVKTEKHT